MASRDQRGLAAAAVLGLLLGALLLRHLLHSRLIAGQAGPPWPRPQPRSATAS